MELSFRLTPGILLATFDESCFDDAEEFRCVVLLCCCLSLFRLCLNIFHHALLCGVSDNSVRFLEHHKEHRLLDVQLSLRLDVLVWVLLIRATELHQYIAVHRF